MSAPAESSWMSRWLPLALFALLWADLCRQLSFHWSTNPQYAFGWSVPFLAALLLWNSWNERPAAEEPRWRALALGVLAVGALLLLPTRLLFEATPDWRFSLWTAALATLAVTLAALYLAGGASWLWHFCFPFAFLLVAVPWPVKLEQPAIFHLSDWVTSLTVAVLNALNTPAVRHGNIIEVSTGVVGVEEACSGIRSFQAAFMASLFLGQFFNLRWPRRLLLVVLGAAFAFACNVARASFLTYVADRRGLTAIDTWHDPAGYTILVACFVVLAVVALCWRRPPEVAVSADAVWVPRLPLGLTIAFGAWLLLCFGGTEAWYRSGKREPLPWWRVSWPTQAPGYREIPLAAVNRLMEADEAAGADWQSERGHRYTMYFFRWPPGPAVSRMLARFHRPEICLPAVGTKLVAEYEPEIIRLPGQDIPFRAYLFEVEGTMLHVFFCVWEDEKQLEGSDEFLTSWTIQNRLRAVLAKRRRLGQQVLEVAIVGRLTEAEARADFQREIAPLVRPDPKGPR